MRTVRRTTAVFAAIVFAAGCFSAEPTDPIRIVNSEDGIAPGSGFGGRPADGDIDLFCGAKAVACVASISGTIAACTACVGVATCIACAGAGVGTYAACDAWVATCRDHSAKVGDACTYGYQCETGGLYCVNGQCSSQRGSEGDRCSRDGDCLPEHACVNDAFGTGKTCVRDREVGELCDADRPCPLADSAGMRLTCDPKSHECRRAKCSEIFGSNGSGCVCASAADCPGSMQCNSDQRCVTCLTNSDCKAGFECHEGKCESSTVTVLCACQGNDPPECADECNQGTGGFGGGTGGGSGTTCGNQICETGESFLSCPLDCSTAGSCGDGYCDPFSEGSFTCPADCVIGTTCVCGFDCPAGTPACASSCGDGQCDLVTENTTSCPQDCSTGGGGGGGSGNGDLPDGHCGWDGGSTISAGDCIDCGGQVMPAADGGGEVCVGVSQAE